MTRRVRCRCVFGRAYYICGMKGRKKPWRKIPFTYPTIHISPSPPKKKKKKKTKKTPPHKKTTPPPQIYLYQTENALLRVMMSHRLFRSFLSSRNLHHNPLTGWVREKGGEKGYREEEKEGRNRSTYCGRLSHCPPPWSPSK